MKFNGKPSLQPVRVLLSEEGLRAQTGHWYPYLQSIHDACRRQGIEVVVAAHREVDPEIARTLNARRVFRYSRWDGIYEHKPLLLRRFYVFLHNWRLYRDLAKFLKREEPFDYVFAGNNLIYHVIAWRALTKRFAGIKFHQLILLFVQDAGEYPNNSHKPVFPRRSWLLRKVLRSFRSFLEREQVVFAAETDRSAEQFRLFTGHEIKRFPHATEFEYDRTQRVRKEAAPLTFACLGFARYEKGNDLLQKAILLFRERYPELEVHFFIQWRDAFTLPDGSLEVPHSSLRDDPLVTLYTESLNPEQYVKQLDRTDAMILPYRRSSYYTRLSRVTIEAMIAGIPLVFTKDTWLEDAVRESGAGVGFENENAEDLASAIAKLATNYEDYRLEAESRIPRARAQYSPDLFVNCLLGKSDDVLAELPGKEFATSAEEEVQLSH